MIDRPPAPQWAALYRRGLEAFGRGHAGEALGLLEQALEAVGLCPLQAVLDEARLRSGLGGVLGAMGRHGEAAVQLREAVRLRPDYADAWRNLGVALEKLKQLDEAVDAYRRALAIRPNDPRTHAFLGNALVSMGRDQEAEQCYQRAAELDPKLAEAQSSLGRLRHQRGRFLEAVAPLRKAVELRSADDRSWRKLADTHLQLGDAEGFVKVCRERLKVNPGDQRTRSGMLYGMHYLPEYGAGELYGEHLEWGRCCAQASCEAASGATTGARVGDRKLRVGYVSPDFRSHTVTRFISPAIEHHDRERFEVICYSNSSKEDETTQRLKQWAAGWRDISRIDDSQACRLIREDQIDVLVDLRGHGSGNRLALFAMKPASVQATMVGYFDTTGLPQMDYRITDEQQDPHGISEQYHIEKLVRLPGSCWCYDPYGKWPEIADPPAMRAGHVTFGCLNKIMKVSRPCAELWAQILRRVPNSRLALVAPNRDCATFTIERLGGYGFPVERLDIWPRATTRSEYLERFNRIDVSLDPLPFNGITTTCESLWMGVPVVSLAGKTSVSRAGRSILHAAGMGNLAANAESEFVAIISELARDLNRLIRLRHDARQRMAGSALMNHRAFAAGLDLAYHTMWQTAINGAAPQVSAAALPPPLPSSPA